MGNISRLRRNDPELTRIFIHNIGIICAKLAEENAKSWIEENLADIKDITIGKKITQSR